MKIGDRIKKRRKELGFSADAVAEMLGKDRSTVYRYESGDIENYPVDILDPLAKILKTTPAYLMGWDEVSNDIIPFTGMVPILGSIPAGVPVLAKQNIEGYMPVTVKNPDEYFALHVHGTSMIGANIPDGATVLIHRQPCAENGQIVACRVNGDEATLKRFRQVGNTVILMPENPEFEPIVVKCSDFDNGYAEIIGVVKKIVIDAV